MAQFTRETITITFGDQAENHAGMQKIGTASAEGYTISDLQGIADALKHYKCELVGLNRYLPEGTIADPAAVLIIRGLCESSGLLAEQKQLQPDTKAFMYGRVVNKHARHNLCFGDVSQEPDYANKKGRVVAWNDVPALSKFRDRLPTLFGQKAKGLVAEGNYYYDISKCGIGYHGDAERKIVVAARLGERMPLHYHWFKDGKPLGETCELLLGHGDVYIMSEKAVGQDWKRRKIYTLRHSAGAPKFTTLPK